MSKALLTWRNKQARRRGSCECMCVCIPEHWYDSTDQNVITFLRKSSGLTGGQKSSHCSCFLLSSVGPNNCWQTASNFLLAVFIWIFLLKQQSTLGNILSLLSALGAISSKTDSSGSWNHQFCFGVSVLFLLI